MTKNKLIYFRNVIYGLSKDYGFRADLYRSTEVTDYHSGKIVKTRLKYRINKAVFLPSQLFRDFGYASLLASLNTNVQVGGLLDVSQRLVLISKKELPRGFVISKSDYFVFNHSRYNIDKYDEMEGTNYWFLQIKKTSGEPVWEVHQHRIRQKLEFSEEIQ